MPKRKSRVIKNRSLDTKDFGAWNFVIFLTVALILLVLVVSRMQGVAMDLRSRAGFACSNPLAAFGGQLPKSSDCSGEWKLSTDAKGCQVFLCQAK